MNTRLAPLLLAALAMAPQAAWARHGHGHDRGHRHAPPVGTVLVTNHSGAAVTVTVGGVASRAVAAWQTVELPVAAGDTTLRATYYQFGTERVLQSDRVHVVPGRTTGVTLLPEDDARLLVKNDSPFSAQLFVDGRPDASFGPYESRVVEVDAGRTDLALVAGGRTLDTARMDLRPYEEPRWIVCPPRVGDLVVNNPHPVSLEVSTDKGLVRTIVPYGSVTLPALPAGDVRLTARRTTGEFVDAETVGVRAGATTGWRIDAPRTGFLALDSDHYLGATIEIDDRRMTTVGPDGIGRLELSVGWHEVEVKDERGREILDTYIEIKPFDVARVSFGRPYHERAHDGRSDRDHDRDRHRHDRDSVADAHDR